jgi:PBP1b-binding outer membrane lipoprotein LpoB
MKFAALLALAAFTLFGCHKKEAEVANQAQNPSDLGTPVKAAPDGKAAESLPPPPPKVAANADNYVRENVSGQVDPALTAQLRAFVQKYGRMPQSFTEFANRGLDSMPHPPDGSKWVIDAPNQQVKAVPMK